MACSGVEECDKSFMRIIDISAEGCYILNKIPSQLCDVIAMGMFLNMQDEKGACWFEKQDLCV